MSTIVSKRVVVCCNVLNANLKGVTVCFHTREGWKSYDTVPPKGQLYSRARQNFTQEALARLGIFKFAEFRYAPQDTLPGCDTLNVRMNATFDLPYDGELEFNVTTKSTDQTGPGAIFSLSRKNFMRTAATLSFQLKGSYEWQTNSTADGNSSTDWHTT